MEEAIVAFTTFKGMKRVMQMRAWTWAEVHDDPNLAGMFLFADLPERPLPRHLVFERRWLTLHDDQPIALLRE